MATRAPTAAAIRTLALVAAVAGVPILGTMLVTMAVTKPDLSDLTPIPGRTGATAVLDWPALRQGFHSMRGRAPIPAANQEVRALGYMLEGRSPAARGTWVRDFVLLPEAGNLIHPAQRIPDQMIAVHLADRILFDPRALVWVWGNLERSQGSAADFEALYTLRNARAKTAYPGDIRRYFK